MATTADVPPAELKSAEILMKELAAQTATFELVSHNPCKKTARSLSCFSTVETARIGPCYARIGPIQLLTPPSSKKVEHYSIYKVTGDGRCMFRALAIGMSINDGASLNSVEERESADELRRSVMEAICMDEKQQKMYEEALIAITMDESITRYCGRIRHPSFWGGESELLVLSRMYKQPVIVYIPESEAKRGGRWNTGFVPIAEYGCEFLKPSKGDPPSSPVRLLFSGGNHYDLLI